MLIAALVLKTHKQIKAYEMVILPFTLVKDRKPSGSNKDAKIRPACKKMVKFF